MDENRIPSLVIKSTSCTIFKTPNVEREIRQAIGKLVESLEFKLDRAPRRDNLKGSTIEVDFDDSAHRYALNLILSCFYRQSELIDFEADKDPMVASVNAGMEALITSNMVKLSATFPLLRPLIDWLAWNFHPLGKWRRTIMSFVERQMRLRLEARARLAQLNAAASIDTADQRQSQSKQVVVDEENFSLANGTKFPRNMADYVIDQFIDGKLSRAEYVNTSSHLLNAADKTSADAFAHTIYQLALDQRIQDKLRQSVARDGAESEYLRWTLNESLRLLPPVGIGCGRELRRDCTILEGQLEGCCLPAGTFVAPNLAMIHRLPEYWGEDADEFKQERFAKAAEFHPMQFMPFGAGIRQCPGKEFALHELKLLLCTLLAKYKFEAEPKSNTDYDAPLLALTIQRCPTIIRVLRL